MHFTMIIIMIVSKMMMIQIMIKRIIKIRMIIKALFKPEDRLADPHK